MKHKLQDLKTECPICNSGEEFIFKEIKLDIREREQPIYECKGCKKEFNLYELMNYRVQVERNYK